MSHPWTKGRMASPPAFRARPSRSVPGSPSRRTVERHQPPVHQRDEHPDTGEHGPRRRQPEPESALAEEGEGRLERAECDQADERHEQVIGQLPPHGTTAHGGRRALRGRARPGVGSQAHRGHHGIDRRQRGGREERDVRTAEGGEGTDGRARPRSRRRRQRPAGPAGGVGPRGRRRRPPQPGPPRRWRRRARRAPGRRTGSTRAGQAGEEAADGGAGKGQDEDRLAADAVRAAARMIGAPAHDLGEGEGGHEQPGRPSTGDGVEVARRSAAGSAARSRSRRDRGPPDTQMVPNPAGSLGRTPASERRRRPMSIGQRRPPPRWRAKTAAPEDGSPPRSSTTKSGQILRYSVATPNRSM